MKQQVGFVKTTIIGGIVFLVPFVVAVLILGKALSLMRAAAEPISKLIPGDAVDKFVLIDLVAIALILVVCFVAGLLARAGFGGRGARLLESKFLDHIPVYAFIKGMTTSVAGKPGAELKPVLARLDDYSQVAFEVERIEDGSVVIYLPGAPNPWSGSVCIMSADRVTPLAVNMLAAASNVRHLGRDSDKLLQGAAAAPSA